MTEKVGSGAPGVTRHRFKAANRLDPGHGLIRRERFRSAHRFQSFAAMLALEFAQCSRALFQSGESRVCARRVQRVDGGGGVAERQFMGDVMDRRNRIAHRLRADFRRAGLVGAVLRPERVPLLAGDFRQPGSVIEGVQRAGQAKLFAR